MERIDRAFEKDDDLYEKAKKDYEEGTGISRPKGQSTTELIGDEPFMGPDEYNRCREETSNPLWQAYTELQSAPAVDTVDSTLEIHNALPQLASAVGSVPSLCDWQSMSPYLKWMLQLHGPDIIKKFGSLAISDKKLLPLGLMSMLRNEKIRWHG